MEKCDVELPQEPEADKGRSRRSGSSAAPVSTKDLRL